MIVLPRRLPGQSLDNYLELFVAAVERALQPRRVGDSYNIVGAERRTLDATTATPGQVADVLATLVADLRQGGVLG